LVFKVKTWQISPNGRQHCIPEWVSKDSVRNVGCSISQSFSQLFANMIPRMIQDTTSKYVAQRNCQTKLPHKHHVRNVKTAMSQSPKVIQIEIGGSFEGFKLTNVTIK
jgi:hypothetical protein